MTPPTEVIVAPLVRDRRRLLGDLVTLTKPRVVLMIVVTTLVGYYVGLTGAPDWTRLLHLAIGTVLAAGGTLALNQYWERDVDARMDRTRMRPLPDARLSPLEAVVFGGAVTVTGLGYPGALPPVTGWVASRDGFGLGAWVLFGILFLWQLPHTLAIARLYRDDYARAGVRLLPVVDADGSSTERQIVTGCLALLVVSLLPTLIGIAGPVYFVGAYLLGAAFVALGARQALVPSTVAARRVLFASLLYLPALLALLAFDKV